MKFSYNWLKQYVDCDWSPGELAEKLTFAGIEVEEVVSLGGHPSFAQVVVCQILSSDKHPNADRLTVCRVTTGKSEPQIVCGAKNYKIGDKVPLALPGVTLPNGLTIKAAKLRGVDSQGMMCSATELGLAEDAEGLLILPPDTAVGATLGEALGGADTVFDIEVTPNRPDWLSVIGIAREVSALTGHPLRLPEIGLRESDDPVDRFTVIKVEAPDLCPRYTARVIRGVKIGPSPAWMKRALEKVGLRSINNVVDVTNYVLLECGHPLHAFDYHRLASLEGRAPSRPPGEVEGGGHAGAWPSKRQIIVRRAENGEQLTVIDGTRVELNPEMLVIADGQGAVALAGVMGGRDSEINDATTDVLLEAAYFLPRNIRKTAKRLGLSTEASYRFERGADIEGLIWATNRAAALIQQTAGGQIARGIADALAKPVECRRIRCRHAQVSRLLGIDVPADTVERIFTGLGLKVLEGRAPARPPDDGGKTTSGHEFVDVEVPTFRVDLEREADLIEEICRIHGVEKIPAVMQPSNPQVSEVDAKWDALMRVRRIMTALGYHEAVNQTFGPGGRLALANPLSSDQARLRHWLAESLFTNLTVNASRHQFDLRLFEVGRVFDDAGRESVHLALAVTGARHPHAWELGERNQKMDLFDVKGALEELAAQLGAGPLTFQENAENDWLRSVADVGAGGRSLGVMAQLQPARAKKLDLREGVFLAEIDLEALLAAVQTDRQFVELPRFPAVVRDVALLADESLTHAQVLAAFERHRNKHLERIELFDIFRGGTLPAGKKSMAYSLTYRAADRTLTDTEVNAIHRPLVQQLHELLRCEIREG